jgi:hypothetical protein
MNKKITLVLAMIAIAILMMNVAFAQMPESTITTNNVWSGSTNSLYDISIIDYVNTSADRYINVLIPAGYELYLPAIVGYQAGTIQTSIWDGSNYVDAGNSTITVVNPVLLNIGSLGTISIISYPSSTTNGIMQFHFNYGDNPSNINQNTSRTIFEFGRGIINNPEIAGQYNWGINVTFAGGIGELPMSGTKDIIILGQTTVQNFNYTYSNTYYNYTITSTVNNNFSSTSFNYMNFSASFNTTNNNNFSIITTNYNNFSAQFYNNMTNVNYNNMSMTFVDNSTTITNNQYNFSIVSAPNFNVTFLTWNNNTIELYGNTTNFFTNNFNFSYNNLMSNMFTNWFNLSVDYKQNNSIYNTNNFTFQNSFANNFYNDFEFSPNMNFTSYFNGTSLSCPSVVIPACPACPVPIVNVNNSFTLPFFSNNDDQNNNWILPLTIGIISILIFATIIYIVITLRKKKEPPLPTTEPIQAYPQNDQFQNPA